MRTAASMFFVPHTFENVSGITTMFVRGGKVIGSKTEILEEIEEPSDVIESFVLQTYSILRNYPEMIYVSGLDDDSASAMPLHSRQAGVSDSGNAAL